MSDAEGFISRWSRRKRNAGEDIAREPTTSVEVSAPAEQPDVAQTAECQAAETEPFDPAALPPIESIGPETDIRAFLAPGVPGELTRAAMRQAWSTDLAIRDFVGLSENSWDFNAGAVPGFGTISPIEVARLARHFVGESESPEAGAEVTAAQDQLVTTSLETEAADSKAAAADTDAALCTSEQKGDADAVLSRIQAARSGNENVAAQDERTADETPPCHEPRRHGRALPS